MRSINAEKNISRKLSLVGIFGSFLMLGLFVVFFYSPVIKTHAEESQQVDVTLSVRPVINLSVDTEVLELNTYVNTFVHDSVNVSVTTNSAYGYTLGLEDVDEDSSMHHVDDSISDTLTSNFSGAKTSEQMDNNTWGFSLDKTNYYYVPTNGTTTRLKVTYEQPSDTDVTEVDFGAKVGIIASGYYYDTVLFSAYVNGQDYNPLPRPLHSITNMQQMTTSVCNATTTPAIEARNIDWDGSHHGDPQYVPRKSLKDTRDGKYYLVSKLSDGNCWMSQNLAFDLTAGQSFVASNNDGTTTIVTPNNTTQTTTGVNWSEDVDVWRSYKAQANEAYYNNSQTKSSTPTGTGVEYDWEKAGNYYNWYAATAGTGTKSLTETEAESSICPKGWRLPARSGLYTPKNFTNLIQTVYFMRQTSSYDNAQKLRSAPFNFLHSGKYTGSSMQNQGSYGYVWSGMPNEATGEEEYDGLAAENFSIRFVGFDDLNNTHKTSGLSVRCVSI